MSFFFGGRGKKEDEAASSSSASSSQTELADHSPSTPAGSSSFPSYPSSPSFSSGGSFYDSSMDISNVIGGARFNSAQLGPSSGINSQQLFGSEEIVFGKTERSWNERLFYGVGTAYLLGGAMGGAWGVVEGFRNPDARTTRLKINSVLNACARRGPFLGNSFGVVTLMYHLSSGALGSARGKDDALNSIASGAIAGLVYKATAGVKAAALASVIGATVVTTYHVADDLLNGREISFQLS